MELKKAHIYNFRSVQEAIIEFTPSFKILVGKNESGKSNILKALSFLEETVLPVKSDLREGVNTSAKGFKSKIIFEFSFSAEEVEDIYKEMKEEIQLPDDSFDSYSFCSIDNNKQTLLDLCNRYASALYVADIPSEKKYYAVWVNTKKYIVNPNLYFLSTALPTASMVNLAEIKIYDNSTEFNDLVKTTPVALNFETLLNIITEKFKAKLKDKHPTVINWQYDEKNLLPDSINIDSFISSPESFSSLKIMFDLAGYNDIKKILTDKRGSNDFHKINNFLAYVANKTTEHFRDVWKEYKEVKFTLNLNGDKIITGIKEKNTFSFNLRSDGFKRFVTFLLKVSVAYKTEELEDAVLLIDEPDISLHPSGIRYLRDELIKISKKNVVVASTHSIFLIDNKCIERHYIVKKEKEVTNIQIVNEDNLVNEEVIYNALGFSFYENLKENNLLFEGWRDKALFKKSLEKSGNVFKGVVKDLGISHINGVKDVSRILPIMEMASRNFTIISDADKIALDFQKVFSKEQNLGDWLTYVDVDKTCNAITGEDFLKQDYIISIIKIIKKRNQNLKEEPELGKTGKGYIADINFWIEKKCGLGDSALRKSIINSIKEELFQSLKHTNIDDKYFTFLERLKEKLTEMSVL